MNLLCATDFSECSAQAVVAAARLARRFGDHLVLLHVVEPSAPIALEVASIPPGFVSDMRRAAATELERQVAGLRAEGLDVESRTRDGFAMEEILSAARELEARTIVMGSHGRHFAARLVAGSVADAVAGAAPCPVLVVRGKSALTADLSPARLRIFAALDASTASDAAVEELRALRRSGPADVIVGHCYWPPGEYHRLGLLEPRNYAEVDPEVAAVVERELRSRVGDLPGDGQLTFRIVPGLGRPADILARLAREEGADLIVTGTHGRTGLARLWYGSVSRDLLHSSPVPVLCAPSRSSPAEAASPTVKRLVCATDLSPLGDRAVSEGFALAPPGATVELLHVLERASGYSAQSPLREVGERDRIEEHLRSLIPADADRRGIHTVVEIVEARSAAEGINGAAERGGCDAIVIGSHGRTGLTARLLGSVAEQVLRGARRAVVVVPRASG